MGITRLKLAREARGLRAYEIARECAITRTQYSLIECGHELPASWLAKRIAAIFSLDVEDLFPGGLADERHDEGSDSGGGSEGASDAAGVRAERCGGSAEAGGSQ
jgi:DNA-binding XRE family transcriptional regulator